MQRYFIKKDNILNNMALIKDDDYYHITKVMRMKLHDHIIICNNEDSWLAEIENITSDTVVVRLKEKLIEKKELPANVTIAHGIVCREKMEEVIDKITQLGATNYIPIQMQRCTAKIADDKYEKKLIRMNKIAKEAAEQSHRTKLLTVEAPLTFNELLKLYDKYDLCLYAYEITTNTSTIKTLISEKKYQNILVLIGPEGGISEEEARKLSENNFIAINLGPRILRTEVAPTYVMAAISCLLEE